MNILITGVAGFIGFSLAHNLLKNNKNKVYGIDNLNNYYSVKLKKKRLEILKQHKNFFFSKIDIINKPELKKYFLIRKKFDFIYHFAAQAGVRYSLINPKIYIDTNVHGFLNICNNLIVKKPNKIIYASSSSVYGDTKNFPINEKDKLLPKNIYGYSKLINETTAEYYSKNFGLTFVGLRFFTIYGQWGRPDMLIMKFLKTYSQKKIMTVNNFGKHYRDFTHIDDVVMILKKLISIKIKNHHIFNISSNNPILILDIVKIFKKKFQDIKYKLAKKHPADILKTHGDNTKVKKFLSIKIQSKFNSRLFNLVKWYVENKIDKIS
jgi:UDP-glucuronate 4-epimerase